MIDVDHFKSINDRWGHDGGGHVLVAIPDTLKRHVREKNILARVGGEEFMVLLRYAESRTVKEAVERLRRAVESEEILLPTGDRWRCTVSAGYCVATCGDASWKEMVVAAD